jgi:hypothetical protein
MPYPLLANTIVVGPFVGARLIDPASGAAYLSGGLTTPGLSLTSSICRVDPFHAEATLEDVITEWSITGSIASVGAGAEAAGSANLSGLVTCFGPTMGLGGPSVGATWTIREPPLDIDAINEAARNYVPDPYQD